MPTHNCSIADKPRVSDHPSRYYRARGPPTANHVGDDDMPRSTYRAVEPPALAFRCSPAAILCPCRSEPRQSWSGRACQSAILNPRSPIGPASPAEIAKKRCQTKPIIRPGAIENAVSPTKTNPKRTQTNPKKDPKMPQRTQNEPKRTHSSRPSNIAAIHIHRDSRWRGRWPKKYASWEQISLDETPVRSGMIRPAGFGRITARTRAVGSLEESPDVVGPA